MRSTVESVRALGVLAIAVTADVSLSEGWEHIMGVVSDAFGRVDVLFNNAGIGLPGTILDTTPEEWDRILGTNLKSVFLGCRTVIPGMLERQRGVIVNMASELGTVGGHGIAAYSASKFGVVGLTKAIALDFAPQGIRVNALCPGPIDTPLLRATYSARKGRPIGADKTPMGRMGTVREAAGAALFLASDASSFMTGATLVVDGGLTAR